MDLVTPVCVLGCRAVALGISSVVQGVWTVLAALWEKEEGRAGGGSRCNSVIPGCCCFTYSWVWTCLNLKSFDDVTA